jgi:tetratricopeptide (TPR) repeat protein
MPRSVFALAAVLIVVVECGCIQLHRRGLDRMGPTIVSRDPRTAREANHRGLQFAQQKQLDQAEQAFREAVRAGAGYAAAYNNLGLILLERRRFYDAALEFQQASRLDRRAVEPVMNLGRLYESVGWHEAAIAQYEKALGLQPDSVEVQGRLAQAYLKMGKKTDAIGGLLRALAERAGDDEWRSWALSKLDK